MMRTQAEQDRLPLLRDVEQQVARVLNHQSFSRSQGPARLLSYLLQNLARCGGRPATQQELAGVLGLAADFDPVSNPLVRMHMSKLRRMLERYARGDGRNDLLSLEIPRNQYRLSAVVNCDRGRLADGGPSRPAANAVQRPVMLIAEFGCTAECSPKLAADMAFQLVAMLAESASVAAIGPGLRSRLRSEGLDVRQFADRCRARFALDGEMMPGRRGLSVVARVIDVASGEVCWSDWLDEPTSGFASVLDDEASMLASRITDKLGHFDAFGQANGVTSDGLRSEGGAAALL